MKLKDNMWLKLGMALLELIGSLWVAAVMLTLLAGHMGWLDVQVIINGKIIKV